MSTLDEIRDPQKILEDLISQLAELDSAETRDPQKRSSKIRTSAVCAKTIMNPSENLDTAKKDQYNFYGLKPVPMEKKWGKTMSMGLYIPLLGINPSENLDINKKERDILLAFVSECKEKYKTNEIILDEEK